ncbi:RHS repeat domain-containing protein [Apibacter sp. B2912]|uniref:RHS repeat domain-containing protein n=1 Tax=Apibacter sp. B2912 TaxID=2656763 RepID=UPI00136F1074|nr:RHS repeat-associated core domain-containing protein [Apibacter sp. B2912]MXO33364.1 hypothetical protein [Apibacter sp. B2912]
MGGQMQHEYTYDGLYRLVQAQGSYTGADNKTAAYSLQMGYDNLHNIVSKNQQVSQQGIMIEGGLKAGYNLSYTYDSTKKNQIKTLQDINYREEESQEEEKRQEHKNYHYDLNGNLTYVNVDLEKKDLRKTSQTQERKLRWDEENRLMSIDDNGYVSNYVYDASGERVIKTSGESEQVYINSLFSGGNTETQGFTAYINPYLVVSPNGKYTKHYYAGSQRIVSKLGDIESFGADPRRIEYAGSTVPGVTINWKAKYQRSIEDLKENYAYFEVPYNGKDNEDYVNGEGFCCSQNTALRAGIGIGNVNYEKMQYYYHPDHLGSSSYITNLDGEIVQHVEYVPFGEVFIEERNNSWNTPYLFNGKELDEETGLYYYGARYYNPRESVWLSVDPLAEKYPNVSPYAYTFQNPIKYIDPRGLEGEGIDPEDPTDLPEVVITGKRSNWFNRNIWKPLNGILRNIGSSGSRNDYISSTKSQSQIMSIPKNIFLSASINNTTTFGNSKVINIDNKVNFNISDNTKEISQDYQLDLNIIKGNIEVTKKSLGAGVGVSLLGRLDFNIGINLNADIKNSEIYLSGSENINKDNNSNGFSVGIKPVSIIIGTINNGLRRILPPTLLEPSLCTPIFGPINQELEIH